MDVLRLLREQQATNRANFAQAQADRAEAAATAPRQYSTQGKDANSGSMAISSDGDEPRLIGGRITSGLIKPGQAVRVDDSGGTVTVDQKPASKPKVSVSTPVVAPGGNIKLLFAVPNNDGLQLWVCGWQQDAVLAFTFPKNAALQTATIDNAGGDAYSLNVGYIVGETYTYLKIVNGEPEWTLNSAQHLGCSGWGFWQGSMSGQISGGTTGSGTTTTGNSSHGTVSTDSGGFSNASGGSLFKIWQGELTSSAQLGGHSETSLKSYFQTDTVGDGAGNGSTDQVSTYNNYERGQDATRLWALPALQLTNNSARNITFDQIATAHIVQHDYETVSSTGSFHSETTVTQASLLYSVFKINETGEAGLGRRQTYSSYTSAVVDGFPTPSTNQTQTSSQSDKLLWLGSDEEVNTQGFYFDGSLIDVFEDYFVTRDLTDTDSSTIALGQAYLWDADQTIKLVSYQNTFVELERFDASIYKVELQYAANQPPVFYSASYHP